MKNNGKIKKVVIIIIQKQNITTFNKIIAICTIITTVIAVIRVIKGI